MKLQTLETYYKWGFSFIWLHPKSKVPMGMNWQNATRKPWNILTKEFNSKNNIGVKPGIQSRFSDDTYLGIIDCDVKSDSLIHQQEMERALSQVLHFESCPHVVSGRNEMSKHYYVRTTDISPRYQIAESAHRVKVKMPSAPASESDRKQLSEDEIKAGFRIRKAWEITFMGDKSQAVFPPSVHPDSGRAYEWGLEPYDWEEFPIIETNKVVKNLKASSDKPFKFVDVDLFDLDLSERTLDLIISGEGVEESYGGDRSKALQRVMNDLVVAGLNRDQIASVVTDSEYWLSEVAFDHAKTTDRNRAAKWAMGSTYQKAVRDFGVEGQFEKAEEYEADPQLEKPEEIAAQTEAITNWENLLHKNKDNVSIKNTAYNRGLILEHAVKKNTLAFNQFTNQIIYKREPPWKKDWDKSKVGNEISNVDLTAMREWFSKAFKIDPSEGECLNHALVNAHKYAYHPVREYLEKLEWDGVPRIDTWLKTYINAEGPPEYLKTIGRKFLIAAVRRVFVPGVKFDYVLIFEGRQGSGKSSALDILGGEWFSDQPIDPTNKDTVQALQGKWIIEMAELASMRKSDLESLKAFITKREDKVRFAYERKPEIYQRQMIFAGSTNKSEYLQDETGARRFWPVRVGKTKFQDLIDDRDQLWAEAYQAHLEGEELFIRDAVLNEMVKEEQSKRYEEDELTPLVVRKIGNKTEIKLIDLWNAVTGQGIADPSKFDRGMQMRWAKIMTRLGFETKPRWKDGKLERLWVKVVKKTGEVVR